MIISTTEFFNNLPPKECLKCGEVIDEMHDCYSHECIECEAEIL